MKTYPYNEDGVAVALAGMGRENLEQLIHGSMQFTADIVGLVTDHSDIDSNESVGDAIVGYLVESGLL